MVVVTSYADKFALAIEEAKNAVAEAQTERSKGGSVDAVNRAYARLGSARQRFVEWQDGRIPDRRGE